MKLENILKSCICAFGENTFDHFSLEEGEFVRTLDYYISDDANTKEMLSEYAYTLEYDIDNIINILQNSKDKDKDWNYIDIINCCRSAYVKTITIDKTLDSEAFIDNVVAEFKKISKIVYNLVCKF